MITRIGVCTLAALVAAPVVAQETARLVVFKPVDMTKLKIAEGRVYPVEDMEANVNDRIIKRLQIPDLAKAAYGNVAVSMRNRTDRPIRPDFEVFVYNRYGMEIGRWHVRWELDTVAAGAPYEEQAKGWKTDITRVLKYAAVTLPKDCDSPAYVMIQYH
jgi:hypothetical protein